MVEKFWYPCATYQIFISTKPQPFLLLLPLFPFPFTKHNLPLFFSVLLRNLCWNDAVVSWIQREIQLRRLCLDPRSEFSGGGFWFWFLWLLALFSREEQWFVGRFFWPGTGGLRWSWEEKRFGYYECFGGRFTGEVSFFFGLLILLASDLMNLWIYCFTPEVFGYLLVVDSKQWLGYVFCFIQYHMLVSCYCWF